MCKEAKWCVLRQDLAKEWWWSDLAEGGQRRRGKEFGVVEDALSVGFFFLFL
jgi:hypothetical protein